MADNYLEKKYEALQQGKVVYRRNTPSLDTLLRTVAGYPGPQAGSYTVKMAQLEAMSRSAALLNLGFRCECSEVPGGSGLILVTDSEGLTAGEESLGAFLLALRLKAAELGLICRIVKPDAVPGKNFLAKVEVLK